MRVVAESSRTARRLEDRALPHALGDERRGVVRAVHEHQHAAIARAPLARRDLRERSAGASRCSRHRPRPARRSARSRCRARRRAHPLRAPSRRRWPAAGRCGAACRAFSSAFAKKVRPVSSGCDHAERGLAAGCEGKSLEQRAEFAQLARDYPWRSTSRSRRRVRLAGRHAIGRCHARRDPAACRARGGGRHGLRRYPAPRRRRRPEFITTFMSVSALESSA